MDIVNRAKNICLTPNTEWPVIAAEATPPATLITEYVVPLAAIGAVAGFIGGSTRRHESSGCFGSYRIPLVDRPDARRVHVRDGDRRRASSSRSIINALAPTFGGQKDSNAGVEGGRVLVHAGVDRGRAAYSAASRQAARRFSRRSTDSICCISVCPS